MNCYVVSQREFYDIPKGIDKDNTLFFPETCMTFHDMMHTGRPKDFHIITDCPFLVSLYDPQSVFVWNVKKRKWENVAKDLLFNTYGSSYDIIINEIFGHDNSIPMAIIDGKVTNVMGRKIKNFK